MYKKYKILNADILKILAMLFMLIDHIGCSLLTEVAWLRYIGRFAFPIFAFQIVEGYFFTSNLKRYKQRLFVFAIISEIPFDLMGSGMVLDLNHQNVLWTFLISLFAIDAIEYFLKTKELSLKLINVFVVIFLLIVATVVRTDYHALGVLTVLVFFTAKKFPEIRYLIMFFGMVYLHTISYDGAIISISFLELSYNFPVQGFSVFSLIFIFLYNGKKGTCGKGMQSIGYWFYPVHMLILFFICQLFVS